MTYSQKSFLALLLIAVLSPVTALHGQRVLPARAVRAVPAPLRMAGYRTLAPALQAPPPRLRPELRTELDAKMTALTAALGTTKEGADGVQKGAEDPASFARRSAVLEKAAAQTPPLQPIDIEGSIEASGMAPRVEELRKHSKGVMTAYEFLGMMDKLRSGYILGVAGAQDTFSIFSEMSGLKPWSVSYREFGIAWSEPDHTRIFMENITRTAQPIVFLVPNGYSTHPRAKLTRDEMDWLLAAPPERMKNVYFVFGAYDLISDADFAAHYKSKGYAKRKEEQIAALKALPKR